MGGPAGGALVAVALLVGGAWLLRGLPEATTVPPEVERSIPPVDAGAGSEPASVRFAVYPWAEIRVDDQAPFLTPRAEPLVLEPGRHRIEFRHPTLGSASRDMDLAAGAVTVIRHIFPGAPRP